MAQSILSDPEKVTALILMVSCIGMLIWFPVAMFFAGRPASVPKEQDNTQEPAPETLSKRFRILD